MQPDSSLSLDDVCTRLGWSSSAIRELARDARGYYSKFERRKRTGGTRLICASQGRLKWLQRAFLDGFLAPIEMPPHVQGCVKGRSARTNAELHVNKEVVINIDLRDFFGSVSLNMVTQLFIDKLAFEEEAAEIFAALVAMDGLLPQGAPTSPAIANLIALKLDDDILRICSQASCSYSRYVDDITISGGNELVELLPTIYEAIEKRGFVPNTNKTRILRKHVRQSVTGVVVNTKATVPKSLLRDLRQQIYYCERWGVKEHCETLGVRPSQFLKETWGKIGYVANIRPELAVPLHESLSRSAESLEETHEDKILEQLKVMIDSELVASFRYERERRPRVATPVAIIVDPEGVLLLRAFQLKPSPGWKFYSLSDMHDLKTAKVQGIE
jgi:RNA-directed DNA polymerase